MNNTNISGDVLDFPEEQKLPSSLNVLTILTIIWCAISFLFTIATPAIYNWLIGVMEKSASSGAEYSQQQLGKMSKARQDLEITHATMVPTMILAFIGIALCFVGALWMRKLKKDGYMLYIIGELLPVVGSFILMAKYLVSDWKHIIWVIIPIVFVILYSAQKKYLIK